MAQYYYYCNYDGSPREFGFNSFRAPSSSNPLNHHKTSDKLDEKFLRLCFERGKIREVWGTLPGSKRRFLLIKKLEASRPDPERKQDRTYYMNIAVAFDEDEKSPVSSSDGESLDEIVLKSIEVDYNAPFAYKVHSDELENVKNAFLAALNTRECFGEKTEKAVIQAVENNVKFGDIFSEFKFVPELKPIDVIIVDADGKRVKNLSKGKIMSWVIGSIAVLILCVLFGIIRDEKQDSKQDARQDSPQTSSKFDMSGMSAVTNITNITAESIGKDADTSLDEKGLSPDLNQTLSK